MHKKFLGGRSFAAFPQFTTAIMLTFSVGYVILQRAEFRLSATLAAIPILFLAISFAVIALLFKSRKQIADSQMTVLGVLVWSISLAFFLPFSTPLLVVSSFLVLMATLYMSWQLTLASTLCLIIGTELSYILSEVHTPNDFWFMVVHTLSLLVIALLGAWHQVNLRTENVFHEQERETARLERERLQALINSMTDGVVATDQNGRVAVYNGSALDILNVNASLEGQIIMDYLNVIDRDANSVDVFEMARSRQGYLVSRDYLLNLGDFENINLYISISPVKIGFGHENAEGYIMLLRDITREKSLEEERDEFISVVSHELRTPITIAEGNIGNAEMLTEKERVSESLKESLDTAHKQVIFLSDMINDLATLSRAERGKLKEAPEDIDIHDLIRGLQRDYRIEAQQKGVELKTFVDKDVTTIYSSRLYVREILQNFLTNAIKYTQQGDVTIRVNMRGKRVEFAVQDSGIGISKSDQKHLFKKFFRSEDYRTRENNGTGLGLYVTMKLAKLISAQISVKSELNKGSTFIVVVPSLKSHKVEVA